jgi:GNAT superfamily N-acetyltransferase
MPELQTTVDAARRREVDAALRAFNTEASRAIRELRASGATDSVPLDVYALEAVDGEEVLVGGLVGATWARWLEVELLWVREDQRGSGLGARLLAEAERIARDERGCVGVHLSTWDFQARPFYEAHGYVVFGVLEDHPPGVTDYYLAKRLDG